MARLVSFEGGGYDGNTHTVKGRFTDENGQQTILEIEGLAFAQFVGVASIEHLVFRRQQVGQELPLIAATGIQTGAGSLGDPKEYGMILSLLVPRLGILNFFLPDEVEKALREKLRPGPIS
jgi:hypothetical protein